MVGCLELSSVTYKLGLKITPIHNPKLVWEVPRVKICIEISIAVEPDIWFLKYTLFIIRIPKILLIGFLVSPYFG